MTTDVADTSLDTQVSEAEAAPLSDDRIDADVLTDTSTAAAEGETSAQEQATTENLADLKGQALYDKGVELQAKVDAGEVLSTPEKQALARHNQSETDKAQAQQYARNQRIENQKRVAQIRQNFPALIEQVVEGAASEGRLLKDAMKEVGDDLFNALEPLVVQPYEAFIRNDAFTLMGRDRKAAEALADADGFAGALNLWRNQLIEYGKSQSDAGQKLTKLQADHDKLKADHAKLLGSDVKGSGSSTSGKQASNGPLSYAQILKLPPEELAKVSDADFLKATGG